MTCYFCVVRSRVKFAACILTLSVEVGQNAASRTSSYANLNDDVIYRYEDANRRAPRASSRAVGRGRFCRWRVEPGSSRDGWRHRHVLARRMAPPLRPRARPVEVAPGATHGIIV